MGYSGGGGANMFGGSNGTSGYTGAVRIMGSDRSYPSTNIFADNHHLLLLMI